MPKYEPPAEASSHAPNANNVDQESDDSYANAVSRLAQEARQAPTFAPRSTKNITHDFTTASSKLESGQLVKDEFFTLFEAVGALEIMDAKMDSGYIPPGDTFEPDIEFSHSLDPAEVLWIMDQLLCLEIAWLDGYPLSQTVFTSLHIDRLLNPKYARQKLASQMTKSEELNPVQSALLGYCIALVACCRGALKLIQSQNFYEEEDFVTHLFGRELLDELDNQAAHAELMDAFTVYSERYREMQSRGSPDSEVHRGILTQLDFRQIYLRLLGERAAFDVSEYWPDLLPLLERVKSNHAFSSHCPAAFSEKVQRELATSTPPRPMLQISWDDACSKWKRLCADMIAAHRFTSSEIIRSSAGLHKAVWAFSYREPPCCLARSEIQSILFGQVDGVKGEIPHHQLLLQDISELVLAGDTLMDQKSFEVELTSDPRHICSRLIEGFMDKAIEEFLNLYRMVCQNRSRIRRTFTQAIPILDELEVVAMTTDQELRRSTTGLRMKVGKNTELLEPLTYWTRFHKLRVMAWTVQLGFETEIYCPDELGSMYWFLAHLSGQRTRLVERITAFTADRLRQTKDRSAKLECNASLDYLKSLQNIARIAESIAEALSTFYKLLVHLDIITPPKRNFADVRLLYEARMKPFLGVWNDTPPDSDSFEVWRREIHTVSDMCGKVNGDVKVAKTIITATKTVTPEQAKYVGTEEEWKREWKQSETTCVAISVAVSQLLRACEKHGEAELRNVVECKPEKKYHEWWVVPQLKERVK